jgi:hypothetical protein
MRRVIARQASQLVGKPPRGQRLQQSLHLRRPRNRRWDHQISASAVQRKERQAVGEGRASHATPASASPASTAAATLQVAGGPGVVPGQFIGRDAMTC